ncbi:MAG: SUMF1/EgtB/PvdO family nonheme iron enzyme [Planctomycetes bacterium]|nr:SUMF1/EgtB/PvdO family nonheme iron enzyme [Planctomycetota bacterium]
MMILACALAALPTPFFSPQVFEANEDCRWVFDDSLLLRMNEHFIAGPPDGADRAAWLAALRGYRDGIRSGEGGRAIRMDYRGVRAWIRVAPAIAKTLALHSDETLQVSLDARSIDGNREVCIGFDFHDRANDRKIGWSGVRRKLALPDDGDWHRSAVAVTVPRFDGEKYWLRPIVGMDATRDPKPGKVEIRDIALAVDDAARMEAVAAAVRALPAARPLDRSIYDRPDLAWMARAFACHFTFMYDRGFFDPKKGEYTLDEFLDDGQSFGGYDAMVLWQGYPRLGVDERNQFDMYRDMPGGPPGLRDLIRSAHDRGVKIFIDYNPWDTGTRREAKSDEEALADLVAAIEADGIFLDTMSATSPSLRERLDGVRPGVVLAPEGHPAISQLPYLSASWAQWLNDPAPPGILHLKWIEPRHMQHQIRRWDRSHAGEIETAFFNGSGILIWENIFGTYNPWPDQDRLLWARAGRILRGFASNFTSDRWDPFYPTRAKDLFANRFPGDPATVFTLLNRGDPIEDKPLIAVRAQAGDVFYDLWNGRRLETRRAGEDTQVIGSIDRIGCILQIPESAVDVALEGLIDRRQRAIQPRQGARSVVLAEPVAPTKRTPSADPPAGMAHVPAARIRMRIEHMARECGCYPDPGTPEEKWPEFLWGNPHDRTIRHDWGPVEVKPFFIDEAEVTNAEFQRFLDATGYRPEHPENFLKHWPDGKMPGEIADLPVVYVDLDDARAYARWAGRRLPTEEEWQLAAQGTDGRAWPWGGTFDPARANTTGRLLPARSIPEGRSPYGCFHMSGNVWEWTESARDDGHTRFVMIRGGSYFKAEGSIWYVPGGPQPCGSHAKFIRMWPGLDRCSTVGFRCVVDAEE